MQMIAKSEETEQQLHDLEQLRNEHQQRLQVLLIQQAQQGYSTPAHIITEIGKIERQIEQLNTTFKRLVTQQARTLEREQRATNTTELADLSRQITDATDDIKAAISGVFVQFQNYLDRDLPQRQQRQREVTIYRVVQISLLILIVILLVLR